MTSLGINLSDQILEFQKQVMPQLPNHVIKVFRDTTKQLIDSGLTNHSLKASERAPSFSLLNIKGQLINSADLLAAGPLVINFYRGGWCPYCNLELRAFQNILGEIEACGGRLAAISPQLLDKSFQTAQKNLLSFEVLSDIGNKTARRFGLVFSLPEELRSIYGQFGTHLPEYNGDNSYELPVPATYVIAADGIIAHAFVEADYTKRMEPKEIIRILKSLKKQEAEAITTDKNPA